MNDLNDSMKIDGQMRIRHIRDGKVIFDSGFMSNLITSAGKAAVSGLVGNIGSITAFSYIALGTSGTSPVIGDTALNAEIVSSGLTRSVATVSRTTTTVTNDTLSLVYTWTASGVQTIREAGVLNASSSGILLSHLLVSPVITTAVSDQIQITYLIKFA